VIAFVYNNDTAIVPCALKVLFKNHKACLFLCVKPAAIVGRNRSDVGTQKNSCGASVNYTNHRQGTRIMVGTPGGRVVRTLLAELGRVQAEEGRSGESRPRAGRIISAQI
jgi:hypothetical protein